MTKIAILGATGYTALELIKILLRHPNAEIVALSSREDKRPVDQVHPSLAGLFDLPLENLTPQDIASRAECVFSCLPHCASAAVIPELLAHGLKVVDLSADYRLDSSAVFESWYDAEHPDPNRLGNVPYGLPELFRKKIKGAKLVANPGCYPTSAVLPLVPLLKSGMIEPNDIIIDSKSGVSGAGRTAKLGNLYSECNENISAYGIGTHRHTPEINQILSNSCGKSVRVLFTPHLTPMTRGILSLTYSKPTKEYTSQEELLRTLCEFYKDEPFIHIVEGLPGTKDVSGTNYCNMTARVVDNSRILTISVIDNLIKGASGAAVQNFNIMYGYSETTALI